MGIVFDEVLAAQPFIPSLQVPRLRGPVERAGWIGAGFLNTPRSVRAISTVAGRHTNRLFLGEGDIVECYVFIKG